MKRLLALVTASAMLGAGAASAEDICPKYGDCAPASAFTCSWTESSLVNRVCYNEQHGYMVLQLKSTYYHYCGVDAGTVTAFLSSPSLGRFYNARIKGNFDCRVTPPPALN
ncbi:KTSC domain-containing protein [Rhizobium sp. R86522]|uniref:KTSC domain-containing protein n=1 Tax=Rhizobium sp. R86522 TaxID=3093861 RepID=UPI00366C9AF7